MDLQIVSVNGADVTNSSQEDILTLISQASKPITLEVSNEIQRNDNDPNTELETAGVLKLTLTKNVQKSIDIQTEAERSLCDNCRDFTIPSTITIMTVSPWIQTMKKILFIQICSTR